MTKQKGFTQEFEDEAVRLARTSGRTRRELAENLGGMAAFGSVTIGASLHFPEKQGIPPETGSPLTGSSANKINLLAGSCHS